MNKFIIQIWFEWLKSICVHSLFWTFSSQCITQTQALFNKQLSKSVQLSKSAFHLSSSYTGVKQQVCLI